MRPAPLPRPLLSRAFTAADALRLGVPPRRLRGTDLLHPTHGVHSTAAPSALHEWAAMVQLALPEDALFSHVTAARLWGLPLPSGMPAPEGLDVMS